MSVLPRCICDPMDSLIGKYDPRCNRHFGISRPVDDKRVEQLAYIMSFLHSLGFDLEAVKRAADAWWAVKAGAAQPVQSAPRMLTNLEALKQLWQPCDLPDFRDPAFTKWRELPSDGEFVYRRDPENILSWLRAPIPQPTKDTQSATGAKDEK